MVDGGGDRFIEFGDALGGIVIGIGLDERGNVTNFGFDVGGPGGFFGGAAAVHGGRMLELTEGIADGLVAAA